MKPRVRLLTALAAAGAAVALACDDNPFIAGSFAVDGRWTGSTLAGTAPDTLRFHFDLTLEQERNAVRGSGVIHTRADTFPVDVDGRWDYPRVNLVMRSDATAPLTFDAQFDEDTVPRPPPDSVSDRVIRSDTLVGTLRGSGLDDLRLELGRTP